MTHGLKLAALVLLLVAGVALARAHAERPLRVDYYYIPYCLSCARVLHGLERFPATFGARVEVHTVDCFSDEGRAAAQKYGFVTHGIVVRRGDTLVFEQKDHGVSADDVRAVLQEELARR